MNCHGKNRTLAFILKSYPQSIDHYMTW